MGLKYDGVRGHLNVDSDVVGDKVYGQPPTNMMATRTSGCLQVVIDGPQHEERKPGVYESRPRLNIHKRSDHN